MHTTKIITTHKQNCFFRLKILYMNHFTFNDVLKWSVVYIHTVRHFSLGTWNCKLVLLTKKRDKSNKCTFVFPIQKGNTNVPLISKRTVFVCSKTQQKVAYKDRSQTNSSTEGKHKALSDRSLTLWLLFYSFDLFVMLMQENHSNNDNKTINDHSTRVTSPSWDARLQKSYTTLCGFLHGFMSSC